MKAIHVVQHILLVEVKFIHACFSKNSIRSIDIPDWLQNLIENNIYVKPKYVTSIKLKLTEVYIMLIGNQDT